MKVYVIEEWETGEKSIEHIASTKEKAIEYLNKNEQFYFYGTIYEIEIDGDYTERVEIFTRRKLSDGYEELKDGVWVKV
jgi:hypothetical protein